MQEPSVGRVVHFFAANPTSVEPLAAIIAKVHSPSCVNLCVISANGQPRGETIVPMRSSEYQHGCWDWPVYVPAKA